MTRDYHDQPFILDAHDDDAPRCTACGDYDATCFCAPCNDCATLTQRAALNLANDKRWRCPSCHIRAVTKILCSSERPAFIPPPSSDLKRTVETPPVSMRDLVQQGYGR